ncbi:PLD nuclease N-terminal domain-containing protein [Pseudomonas sp. GOM7]|uniref:PLD nuclease N-terminal domain-containing protein n=1 Tax=Pseudomonas sp. GOM7 TaxID=2998079 RepID=UPI00227AFACB|nr:PLD nuclease N-terminal domain-containing protein [Pseudomonas sp. GOM7]WAJ35505.1 PLD nuclease N-terminal domain-containing protein [Pseudomonas sp. GOM7]
MPDALVYFWIALAVIIALIHLWAIVNVFRSDKPLPSKTRWALFIGLVPVIGLVVWGIAGPRGHDDGPQSPEHSK